MANIINAIINLVQDPQIKIEEYSNKYNRANSEGKSLEQYVLDLFAGTLRETDLNKRHKEQNEVFSYLGNANNPPDAMLKGGDAIEVKKVKKSGAALALNSSYPKHRLKKTDIRISKNCKAAENWEERDILYIVGTVNDSLLSELCFVYGTEYCASSETYERISNNIKESIKEIPGLELKDTNELAHINCVDPLGITYFRARGMWGIVHPSKVYSYIYKPLPQAVFNFMALINSEKYDSLQNHTELEQLALQNKSLEIKDVEVQNPNNPAQLISSKLITYTL
jgi:hypothetical protein